VDARLGIFVTFLEEPLSLIRKTADEFRRAADYVNKVDQPGQIRSSNLLELTNGMLIFMNKYINTNRKNSATELHESEGLLESLEEFWFSIDNLYDAAYGMVKIVSESRDIVRTCYVYTINFYKWNLRPFDSFDPSLKAEEKNQKSAEKFVSKLLGNRNFVDVALFLSLADFTTSPYQNVVQAHPLHSQGMTLKLRQVIIVWSGIYGL
jgi:hypothetical protein